MRPSGKTRTTINLTIIGISMLTWVLLLFNSGHAKIVVHCYVPNSGPSAATLEMLPEISSIPAQLTAWGWMVVAMMLPKLIIPIQHIYSSSLKRHRFPSTLLFTFGYMAVWMTAGIVMIVGILGLHMLMPGSSLPAIGSAIIAIVWQFSPIKQRCLNRGHDHWRLAAFGWPAYRDPLLFGVMHGVWCVGSGWAIMLMPMIIPNGHNLSMIIVTLIMLSEHLEHPQIPRWRIDLRAKLFRIIVAQTQIKLKRIQDLN